MARKWYGNINNRLEENRQFVDEIKVGTGVTEYHYSDRTALEVIEVKDQKHIVVRLYDHKLKGEAYSNDWELISNPNNPCYYLTKRGNYWYYTNTLTAEEYDSYDWEKQLRCALAGFDPAVIHSKGKQTKYRRANISIGKASYYYDYEF